jgi:hypothetical protein
MALYDQAKAALASLATFSHGNQVLGLDDGQRRLSSDLVALDTLAVAFESFAVETSALADATVDRLKQISNTLSKRISYLLEPINPIEIDAEQCLVQMRSSPPSKDDDGTSYYELVVRRGGELRLSRYAKSPGQPRRNVPAQVTREVFLRLVADFSAAV